jgi:phosphoesterase family protein
MNKLELKAALIFVVVILSTQAYAISRKGKYFDRAIFVVFENTNYAQALKQPFFGKLAKQGALFSNFMAITHPSQGNYIALTSGSLNGVHGDDIVDLDVKNIVDLLEARGITWRVYAENYPGNCFTGKSSQDYERKHNPFISYVNIQRDPQRCANIVNASQFDKDASNGNLPEYVFYVPNIKNDGHDTSVTYADNWYSANFLRYISDPGFLENTVLVTTFDESGTSSRNQIYTSVVGTGVNPGVYSQGLNLFSLLKMVEDNWNLGDLGKQDATAVAVPNIWK